MQALVLATFLLFSVAASVPLQKDVLAPWHGQDSPDAIPDEYIVVFNSFDLFGEQEVASHMQLLGRMIEAENGSRIGRTYNIQNRFRGYHAVMSPRTRDWVRSRAEVKYVEQNQVVTLDQTDCIAEENPDSWGLVRVSIRENKAEFDPLPPYDYSAKANGEGVYAYIIDTGIDTKHSEFSGRAFWGKDFIDGTEQDGNGHGTHVAGTVIGDKYGLAKKATAIAVRVLNSSGSGSFEGVIAGIEYTAEEFVAGGKKVPSVANMSLGGGANQAMFDAVQAAVEEGVMFVVAAGNSFADACSYSPAASEYVMTAAATDRSDTLAYYSNHGRCVEILAPGTNIKSAWPNEQYNTISGTSMASPHVAGVAVQYLTEFVGKEPLPTPQEVEDALIEMSSKDMIAIPDNAKEFTPNQLLFYDCA